MKVFSIDSIKCLRKDFSEALQKCGVVTEINFEQVIAMAKLGELEKLCIYMDVNNVSGRSFNCMRGQSAAEKIHEINPSIPILIWDGREYDGIDDEHDLSLAIPPTLVFWGTMYPIKNKNELYPSIDYQYDMSEITIKFFKGTLTKEDVPKAEYLEFIFK